MERENERRERVKEGRTVHWAAEGRCLGLRVHRLGADTVLLNKADDHVPLTTIVDRGGEQELQLPRVQRLSRSLDDRVQEIVGTVWEAGGGNQVCGCTH